VSGQFAADAHVALARLEAVDRTDVVQSAARDVVARRRVRTRHHPAGPQRYRVHLSTSSRNDLVASLVCASATCYLLAAARGESGSIDTP